MSESPYRLTLKNTHDRARHALIHLSPNENGTDARLVQIQHCIETERQLVIQKASYAELSVAPLVLIGPVYSGLTPRENSKIVLWHQFAPYTRTAYLHVYVPDRRHYSIPRRAISSQPNWHGQPYHCHDPANFCQLRCWFRGLNVFVMSRCNYRTLIFFGVSICLAVYLAMGIAGTMTRTPATLTVIGIAVAFPGISYRPAVGASMIIAGEVSSINLPAKPFHLLCRLFGKSSCCIYSIGNKLIWVGMLAGYSLAWKLTI